MKFGITQTFSCSYLPEEQEQLLVFAQEEDQQAWRYGQLIQAGFRRSGEQIYRPHCPACQACQSIRIPVNEFDPSRSQRRVMKANQHIMVRLGFHPNDQYYPLYETYINARHSDGSMYPPSRAQFDSFIYCKWKQPIFVEAYDKNKLIAVAVTDDIDNAPDHLALSALYTFYDPEYEKLSLGTWMILQQIDIARQLRKSHLYLGYQVQGCQKMAYKEKFTPHERFFDNKWHRISKNMPPALYTKPDIG